MKPLRALVVSVLSLLFVTTASAQYGAPSGISIGGNVGYYGIGGDDFSDTDDGIGFQGFLRYTTQTGFAMAGGVQYNSHEVIGTNENASVLGVFAEPRYFANIPNSIVAPFVGGRVGWARNAFSMPGTDLTRNGIIGGFTGGSLFQVAPQVAVEAAFNFWLFSFGDATINGSTVEGTDRSGNSWGIAGGLVFTIPR